MRPLQTACSIPCALEIGRENERKAQNRAIRARSVEAKRLTYWAARAQKAFNAFIRERDKSQPCITCGTWEAEEWHAGHWIPVGRSSALRFDEANCHRQCRQDNYFGAGRQDDYEMRLPARIGQAEVDRLKHAKREHRWTREEYQAIEAEYKQKLKELIR